MNAIDMLNELASAAEELCAKGYVQLHSAIVLAVDGLRHSGLCAPCRPVCCRCCNGKPVRVLAAEVLHLLPYARRNVRAKRGWCPLLRNGKCGVYAYRPLQCIGYQCLGGDVRSTHLVTMGMAAASQDGLRRHLAATDQDTRYYNLAQAVKYGLRNNITVGTAHTSPGCELDEDALAR